jgi:dihydrofolate synthase / folylpolyglutamate synthase
VAHERYFEAVDYLQRRLWHELPIVPVERALQHRVSQVLTHLGDPQLAFPVIHIAGSAGKGSTAAITASILRSAGLRTGLYTKPHLQTFIERGDVNGRLMAPDAFAEAVLGLDPLVRKMHLDVIDGIGFGRPSLVEVAFPVCMRHFADERVDVAVVEAGLGGRTDYTNVFDEKAATVITNVSYEHRERLGWSLTSIAHEKAAIIRRDPVVTGAAGEALRVIAAKCADTGAPLLRLKHEVRARVATAGADGSEISVRTPSRRIERTHLALAGAHQVENAALAVAAVDAYGASARIDISDEQIRHGLASVRLSGRLEQVQDHPRVLLDAAHNPAEARRFVQTVRHHWLSGSARLHLVAGILADKDQVPMVRAFASIADRVLLTQPPLGERIGDPSRMLALFRRELGEPNVAFEPSYERAFDIALADAAPADLICVTGSMFLVGALRERWVPEQRILDSRTAALELDHPGG